MNPILVFFRRWVLGWWLKGHHTLRESSYCNAISCKVVKIEKQPPWKTLAWTTMLKLGKGTINCTFDSKAWYLKSDSVIKMFKIRHFAIIYNLVIRYKLYQHKVHFRTQNTKNSQCSNFHDPVMRFQIVPHTLNLASLCLLSGSSCCSVSGL